MLTSSELLQLSKIQENLNVSVQDYSSAVYQTCDCTGCVGTCANTSTWSGTETY